jgi:signal transduction histidine kinase
MSATHETTADLRAAARARRQRWAAILGFWTCFGLLNGSQLYLGLRLENFPVRVWLLLGWALLGWLPWAALTPIILWLGRRFPFERASWPVALVVHLTAGTLLSALHLACFTYITIKLSPFGRDPRPHSFWELFLGRATSQFHIDMLLYGATLGVSYAFSYYGRYRERERRAAHLEAQLAQAQLQALKMQLHPHFLFNTLNAIAGLVRDQRNKAAVDMLAGLSDLLRYTLENAGKQEVPLREELGFLELYLNIQQMRFSDRLQVELSVAPDTLDALVPNLILQPLVENAIRHGVAQRARAGTVGVTAARAQPNGEAQLRLTVYDDGPGLRAERPAGERTGGVGLANTRARLAQLYGAAQQFTIAERATGGVEATLVLPFKRSVEG